jgi:hypothetical protein
MPAPFFLSEDRKIIDRAVKNDLLKTWLQTSTASSRTI